MQVSGDALDTRALLDETSTYLFWRGQMDNLFRINHVFEIVEEKQTILPEKKVDGSTNPDHQVWLKKN